MKNDVEKLEEIYQKLIDLEIKLNNLHDNLEALKAGLRYLNSKLLSTQFQD